MKRFFEMMRHAPKDESGEVSEEGREQTAIRAGEFFQETEKLPPDAVICFVPSNVSRAKETKGILENKVEELVRQHADRYVIATLGEDNVEDIARKNPGKKLFLKTTFHNFNIGFVDKPDDPAGAAFDKYWERFGKSEDIPAKIWATHNSELEELKEELRTAFPGVEVNDIQPAEFVATPEEQAMPHIEWMKWIQETADQAFPDRPVKIFGVSHNIQTDFTDMALLEMPISLKSVNELGGTMRQFLESSMVTMDGDTITVEFRNQKKSFTGKDLDKVLQELKKKSEERKREWSDE